MNIDGYRLTHLLRADNIWLFASSKIAVQAMMQFMTDVLTAEGLAWKPSFLECMTSGDQIAIDDGFDIAVQGYPMNVPRTDKLTCLCTKIRFDGDTISSMKWRVHIAFKLFFRMNELFC